MRQTHLHERLRVLVVEDHSVVRWAICNYLKDNGIDAVGEASSPREAVELAETLKPDVVIMDLLLGEESGLTATQQVAGKRISRVIAYSAYDSSRHVRAFLDAGGAGFVSKLSPVNELIDGLHAVCKNRTWVSPRIRYSPPATGKDTDALTRREREVARLIARGYSSGQIAERLCLSVKTVQVHRYHIFQKLGIHKRAELVQYVIERNML